MAIRTLLASTCLGTALIAQMPPGWDAQRPLGQVDLLGKPWYGYGLWFADHQGPVATLANSLGLGNALIGNGVHLEAGIRTEHWDLAAQVLAGRKPEGGTEATLYRFHASWRSREQNPWQAGLEREPLVWGYGLNGGYLLGEAARPFPRLRVESPMAALHVGSVPLGTWGFQAFLGRLGSSEGFSGSVQNPLHQQALATAQGVPQSPFMTGYRVQARFGESLEFYANYINLWGGTLNGQNLTSGYNLGEYLTSMFGLKDTLAEANLHPGQTQAGDPYKNKARSASNADLGFRLRVGFLERALGADSAHLYLSRGSKNVWWNPGVFIKNPLHYIVKDISKDARGILQARFAGVWNETGRYSSPNMAMPNDTVGVLVAWPRIRVGLEFLDTANDPEMGVRSFSHYIYLAGFYSKGDPLGNAIGGEARTTSARVEADLTERITSTTLLNVGSRPFRENTDLWLQAHSGLTFESDRFFGLQQTLRLRLNRNAALELGAAWQRHRAVDYLPGNSANGFRYYADLSFRWPGGPRQ